MAILGDSVNNVMYNLGNRSDLTVPIEGSSVSGVVSVIGLTPGFLGEGYQIGDILGIIQAEGSGAFFEVSELDAQGNVADVLLLSGGQGYTTAGNLPTVGGTGIGLLIGIEVKTVAGPSRIELWLKAAYINLMMENRFPGTEGTFTFNLIQGSGAYAYPTFVRAIEALTLYRPDGTIITVETKDVKYIRRMNAVNQAAPSMWCEYGNLILMRPIVDGNGPYQCVLDVWLNPIIDTQISNTENLLPLDWVEALEYSATVRGHINLQEDDKARSVQSLLYGFTDPSGKYTPGVIQNLQTRMQASAIFKDWGVQPKGKTQSYTRRG